MRLRALWFSVFLVAAGCRPDVESQVPCHDFSDLSCPTGWHCDPETLLCVGGENQPRVTFSELRPDAELYGHMELEFSVISAVGLAFVDIVVSNLASGEMIELTLTQNEGSGVESGTWSAPFETWWLDDGAAVVKVTAGDEQGGVREESVPVEIRNGIPNISIGAAKEKSPGRFEIHMAVSSKVPIATVEVEVMGNPHSRQPVAINYTTNESLVGEGMVVVEADPTNEPQIEVTVTDVASRKARLAFVPERY